MDYAKLELKMRRSAEKALSIGWCLEPGEYFPREYQGIATCCAVGALGIDLVEYEPDDAECELGEFFTEHRLLVEDASEEWKKLGIDEDSMLDIAKGFDGESRDNVLDPRLYAIGANIRRIYYDDNGQVE